MYPRIYDRVRVVRVRRVGNSKVVTVPRELDFESEEVLVEKLNTGQLLLTPVAMVRSRIPQISARVVRDNAEALRILEEYDRKA